MTEQVTDTNEKQQAQLRRRKALKNEKRRRRRRRRKIFLGILLVLVLILGIGAVRLYPKYASLKEDMYDSLTKMDESTFKRVGNTEIYDNDGKLIGRLGNEKYEYLKISDIPENITKGYIAAEDKRFYTHHGVDYLATIRAGLTLIKNGFKITQGGSTITQQVVKNNLLTQERSYTRKILEILLAFELEKKYNKAEIMEFYCNSCYYGQNCYGIEGASEYYFGKKASQLTLGETAMLVGTSNSPNNYNPVANYELSMEKKAVVLERMLDCGYIDEDEYEEALAEEPEIVQKSDNVDADSYTISYAIHCAALKLMETEGFTFQYTFSSDEEYEAYQENYSEIYNTAVSTIRGGGYTIYTSLDSSLQKKLQKSVDTELSSFKEKQEDGRYLLQGAAICINNKTQMVAAVVGGRGKEDSYNRGYQAKRQPGSAIKPLLDYAPALNEGEITPASVYNDEKTDYNGYSPANAGDAYYGNVTVREALARSLNSVALQVFEQTGISTSLSYLDKLHFSTLTYADSTMASISIGGFSRGVTVEDMARGYATLANGGEYSDATCLISLENYADGVIYSSDEVQESQVYLEDTAFMVTDMMEGTFREEYGTAHAYDTGEQYYAGKTGTTNDNKDAWFCGYSRYYTTVVWVGCDTPQAVDDLSGSTYPARIWSSFMAKAHSGKKAKDFKVPSTVQLKDTQGNTKTVDYSSSVYSSRPSGWDYFSTSVEDILEQKEKQRQEKKLEETAEDAVTEFEDYQITGVEEAENLEATYNSLVEQVMQVGDSDIRQQLLERAAYKYNLLSGDVVNEWQQAIDEEKAAEQETKDAQNLEDAQSSYETALKKYQDGLESVAQWYIDHLNKRTLYSSYTQKMIDDGETAVENCADLADYATLRAQFDAAKEYAVSLPRLDETQDIPEAPALPEESAYPED